MQVKITPSHICGKVTIPTSKSFAHRALITAFLSGEKVKLLGEFFSDDILTTIDCLVSLGLAIEKFNGGLTVQRTSLNNNAKIYANESGSTLRFIIPVISALGVDCEIDASKRLVNRPISELLQVLVNHGARFTSDKLPFFQSGKISSGRYEIDGSISSQYVTGLLLALSYLKNDSEIVILNKFVSKDYVKITLDVLASFGVKIIETQNGYIVSNKGKYCPPKEYAVEGDWSSACFLACAGALTGEVTLNGLSPNSTQGDKVVIDTLIKIGAQVEVVDGSIKIKKSRLNAITFDAENYPDFVPVLSVTLACCNGISKITNVGRLKDKESDRIYETLKLINAFGIDARLENNEIIIHGGQPKGCVYHSPNDHRMTMSASVLALASIGETQILGAECINKSYPSFFEQLKLVGGKVSV